MSPGLDGVLFFPDIIKRISAIEEYFVHKMLKFLTDVICDEKPY
jgi:hypothetical protein